MHFLSEYGLFLLKSITIVVSGLILFAGIISLRNKPKATLQIKSLNDKFGATQQKMSKAILGKKIKKIKNKQKNTRPIMYVLKFDGDIKASQLEQFRDEISAVLSVATNKDEVLVQLESPGGAVNAYGLAASQLQRIRDKNIPLTVCIDKVAASGGYLMACVANRIVAAPFAIIGSIGVVAQLPNFYRWLKKHDIDVELHTAGEYKRTLTLLGQNTEKGRKKFQQDLEKIHKNFRDYVLNNREQLNIEDVATGEYWLAKDALDLNLIDTLQTSDDYIQNALDKFNAYKIEIPGSQSLTQKLLKPATKLLHPFA